MSSNGWKIVNPPALGAPRGWNNGVLAPRAGRVLFVAGQIGVDGGGRDGGDPEPASPGALAAQFGVALARVGAVVEAAGGRIADIGRLTIYVTDMDSYRRGLPEVGAAYRRVFGRHFPAMSLVAVAELVEPSAVVEVEATAVLGSPPGDRARGHPRAEEREP